jgi:hypothetical protein
MALVPVSVPVDPAVAVIDPEEFEKDSYRGAPSFPSALGIKGWATRPTRPLSVYFQRATDPCDSRKHFLRRRSN